MAQHHQVDLPSTFAGPLGLRDGRLLCIDLRSLHLATSSDAGRTWDGGWPLVDSTGNSLVGPYERSLIPSLSRLQSGQLALKIEIEREASSVDGYAMAETLFMRSGDEGRTWSDPVEIAPGTRLNTTWPIERRDGRLVLPNEYAYSNWGGVKRVKMSVCNAFTSDDGGQTWLESRDALWVYEEDGVTQGLCEAPVVAETRDDRLLMFMRTKHQRIAEAYSEDGGETWGPVGLNDLVSSNAETYLARVPTTGDLVCVWNQATTREIETGFYRARLTSAVSRDGGTMWESFRTIADSPGQDQLGRIEDPGTPSWLVAPFAVPPPEHMVADEFHMNRAPRVRFVGTGAYVSWTHRVYRYERGERVRTHDGVRLVVMPIDWFYGSDDE